MFCEDAPVIAAPESADEIICKRLPTNFIGFTNENQVLPLKVTGMLIFNAYKAQLIAASYFGCIT